VLLIIAAINKEDSGLVGTHVPLRVHITVFGTAISARSSFIPQPCDVLDGSMDLVASRTCVATPFLEQ